MSGTSSVLGGAGADSITIAGTTSQWLVDAGDDADSLYITNAAQRTTVKGGSGGDSINIGVVSKGLVEAQEGNDTIKVTGTGVTSASLKAGIGDDLMSITGGITDGSLFGGTGNDTFDLVVVVQLVSLTPVLALTPFCWVLRPTRSH